MNEREQKSGLGDRIAKGVLLGVLVCMGIIFFLPLFEAYLIEIPFHALAGWILYLMNVKAQITLNYDLLGSGLVALGLAVAGFHAVARGLWRQSKPDAGAWRFRWTASITLLLLLLFASANAGAGIGHQIGWLKTMRWIENRSMSSSMRGANSGRQTVIWIKEWAADHHGAYPRKLDDLLTTEDLNAENYQLLALVRWPSDATPEPWIYFGAELSDLAPGDLFVLASPRARNGRRIVCHNDGSTQVETEEKYQIGLAALRRYLNSKVKP